VRPPERAGVHREEWLMTDTTGLIDAEIVELEPQPTAAVRVQ
jgi:hypothetical protein